MADKKISQLTAAGALAGTEPVPIVQAGATVKTTVQDIANLGGALPVVDTTAIVKGSADATKLLRFEVDGFTTGTTRVLTPPNFDGTIATLAGTETFTGKTLTDPVITNITPGANFTITQNSVTPFVSENTSAVASTLYLKAGNVGVGTNTPSTFNGTDFGTRFFQVQNDTTSAYLGASTTSTGFIAGVLLNTAYANANSRLWGMEAQGAASNTSSQWVISTYTDAGVPTARLILSRTGNLKIAGSATRATTEGDNHLDIFNGTAPVGTLTNGVSLYSASGKPRFINSLGVDFAPEPWDFIERLASDFTVTNGTLSDVTGFSFSAANGETWLVEVYGGSTADNTTGDISVALANTGTWGTGQSYIEATAYNGSGTLTATAPTAFASTTLSTASPGLNINNGDAVIRPFRLRFQFTMTASGTVKLQMGQTAAAGGRASTLKAGTIIMARKIG